MPAKYYSRAGALGLVADGNDANDGDTPLTPWKSSSKFRTSQPASTSALFIDGGDWRDDTAGSNGQFEMPQDGVHVGSYGNAALGKPQFGYTRQAAKAITAVSIASGVATITCVGHGMTSSGTTLTPTVLLAGIGGTATAANGYFYATVTDADHFTVPVAGSGSDTPGAATAIQEIGPRAAFYCNAKSDCAVQGVHVLRALYGTNCSGTLTTPFVVDSVDVEDIGRSGFISSNGTCVGQVVTRCTGTRTRDDFIDFSGTGAWTGFQVSYCVGDHIGFNPDGATINPLTGVGDFCSAHAANYGDTWNCRGTFLVQSGIAHVSTTGTNRVWNCWFDEWRAVGIEGNSGATLIAWNNLVSAPQVSPLDGSNANFCMEVKTTSNGEFYNNTLYTNYGTVGANSVACVASRGTGTLIFKNNRCVSNGSAFFWIVGASAGTITTATNSYSHTGTLFQKSGNKNLASWQSTFGYDTDCVTGATIATVPPTLASHFAPVGGKGAGTNLTGVGIAALNADYYGQPRPASGGWEIGALNFPLPVGGSLSVADLSTQL